MDIGELFPLASHFHPLMPITAEDPGGNYLLAQNQGSDSIVVFRIDKATGKLTPTGEVAEVGAPVCVVFVPAP